ncbi:tail fiber protein [Undibacterium sp. NL8W]|uniref:Tail fiber protein n=2 Tax=Undibacterium umbellatum TaxID=2762300 RepID=A0ABR6Z8E5_9BURK|nr:tail fiber protein [Undibacterium umbellatum]
MMQHGMNSPFGMRSGFGDVPVGAVVAFAGGHSPANSNDNLPNPLEAWGWMVCDGRSLLAVHYPELYAVLGYRYGGQGEQFCIPDYRNASLPGAETAATTGGDVKGIAYIIKYTYGLVPLAR